MDNRQYNKKKVSFSDTFNDGPVAYLPFQTFLHIVHRLFQAAVHDPRIMLRHACGGMSEHDGHVLQGYIVGERDGRPESVPGGVEKKKLYEQLIREESITQSAVYQSIFLYSST